MKRRFGILLLLLPLGAFAQTATSLTANWVPVPATAGVTISGYTATITPPSGAKIAIPACAAATSTNCIKPGQATSTFTWTPGGPLSYGSWSVSIQTNATNSAGTALTAAASATAVYALPPVTVAQAVGGVTIQFTLPASQ